MSDAPRLVMIETIGEYVWEENMAWLLYDLGSLSLKEHDLEGATIRFCESVRLAHDLGLHHGAALNLDGLAAVCIRNLVFAQAARVLRVADLQWKRTTSNYSEAAKRDEHQQLLAVARGQLASTAFAAAWQAGQTLTVGQIIAEMLDTPMTSAGKAASG
jgi:hypothetical protein